MGVFEFFPYVNFHELNLDWILAELKKLNGITDDNVKRIDQLEQYIDPATIQAQLYVIVQQLIDDGTLAGIVSQAAGVFVTPEMFGAVGDGITDDSVAINDAIDTGKPVYFEHKTYNARLGITSTINYILGNDATILIGDNTLTYEDNLYLYGINFVSDYVSSKTFISFGSVLADSVKVERCTFVDLLATDAARPRTALRARAVKVDVNNIYVLGVDKGVVFNNSNDVTSQDYIKIANVLGCNTETLVDIEGAYGANLTGSVSNVTIDNVTLYNTANQKANMATPYGRDAVLAGGVNYFTITNVISYYAKERAVYVNNAKHGIIDNVIAVHSEGIKIAGTTATGYVTCITEDIHASNIHVFDGYQAFLIKIYDVKNITINNVSMDGGNYADPDTFRAIEISRTAKNILIDGVNVREIGRGIISFEDDNITTTDIENILIKNVNGYNFTKTTAYDAVNFFNTVPISNIKLENFELNIGMASYNAATNFAHFLNAVNVNGLYIDNIIAFGFSTTEEPIKIDFNTCSDIKILNTNLFLATAADPAQLPIDEVSNYTGYTLSNNATYKYIIKCTRNALIRNIMDIIVYLPCPRNIYGDMSNNKTIIIEGKERAIINVVSGVGTSDNANFSINSYGVITGPSGWYKVTVIYQ